MTKGKKTKTIIYKSLHRKLEIEQHVPHNKTRGELRCPGMKNTSYSTSGNRRANYHGFVTRVTRRVPIVEQEPLPFRST